MNGEERPRPSVELLLLGILALALASLEWRNWRFGVGNQAIQLAFLKHILDPSLYPRDPIVGSFAAYSTYFFHLVSIPVRITHAIEPVYYVLFVVSECFTLLALYRLSTLAFGEGLPGVLACLMYIEGIDGPGGESTSSTILTHGSAATALLLWALVFHLAGRRLLAFFLAGLAANIHALFAFEVLVLLGVDSRPLSRGGELVRGLGLFALAASPTLLWLVRAGGIPGEIYPLWLDLLKERSAVHVFLGAQSADVMTRWALALSLGVVGFGLAPPSEIGRSCARLFLGVGVFFLLAWLLCDRFPVAAVLRFQPLRASRWASFLSLPYAGYLLACAWRWGALARLASCLGFLGILLWQPAFLALSLALLLASSARELGLSSSALACGFLLLAALSPAVPYDAAGSAQALARAAEHVAGNPLVVALLGTVALACARPGSRLVARAGLALVILVVAPLQFRAGLLRDALNPWVQVQQWASQFTPADAIFLTPPQVDGFRVFSGRSIVGEWKDGTQQFFAPAYALEWKRRMEDLGAASWSFDALDAERLVSLARKYDATYIVSKERTDLKLKRLWGNGTYAVYLVEGA